VIVAVIIARGMRHVKQHKVIRFRSVSSLSCGNNNDDDGNDYGPEER